MTKKKEQGPVKVSAPIRLYNHKLVPLNDIGGLPLPFGLSDSVSAVQICRYRRFDQVYVFVDLSENLLDLRDGVRTKL